MLSGLKRGFCARPLFGELYLHNESAADAFIFASTVVSAYLLPGRPPGGVHLGSSAFVFSSPLQTWRHFFLLLNAACLDLFRFVSARDFLVTFSSTFSASAS
jgi:hypothetical protein